APSCTAKFVFERVTTGSPKVMVADAMLPVSRGGATSAAGFSAWSGTDMTADMTRVAAAAGSAFSTALAVPGLLGCGRSAALPLPATGDAGAAATGAAVGWVMSP